VKQCNVPELQRLLEFLVPIIHPKKPTFVPVSLANTVIVSWLGVAQMNWAHILQQTISSLVDALEPGKTTVLPSYLAQLYKVGGCLMPTENKERKEKISEVRVEEAPSSSDSDAQARSESGASSGGDDAEERNAEEGNAESPEHIFLLRNQIVQQRLSPEGVDAEEGNAEEGNAGSPVQAILLAWNRTGL
jgi:hypothetical protein